MLRLSAHPPIRRPLPSHTLDLPPLVEFPLVQSLLSAGSLGAPPRAFGRPAAVRTTLRAESWAAIRYSLRCCAMAELRLLRASSTSAAGSGILAALLAAAEQCDPRSASEWPPTWAPPPLGWTLRGFDLRADAIAAGQRGLFDMRARVLLSVGDVREVTLPECDVVVMLDVLHYVDRVAQRTLLTNACSALAPGGALLLRVADAAPNWRFRFTSAVDWWVTFARQKSWPELHWRPLAEWTALLEAIGFSVVAQPMSEGTLFANVLLIATKRSPSEQ